MQNRVLKHVLKVAVLWLLLVATLSLTAEVSTNIIPKSDIYCHIGFENDIKADIGAVQFVGDAERASYQKGITGQSLVILGLKDWGKSPLTYKLDKSLMQKSGSLSFWLAPGHWLQRSQVQKRDYFMFVGCDLGGKASLNIYRQGFSTEPKRKDTLIVQLTKIPNMKDIILLPTGTETWADGEWHLIVVNWDSNSLSVSIDGTDLRRTEFSRQLEEVDFPNDGEKKLRFGGGNTVPEENSLIDDFSIYQRPLAQAEIREIYKTGKSVALKTGQSTPSFAKEIWITELVLPFLNISKVPRIDGEIDETEWSGFSRSAGVYKSEGMIEPRGYVSWFGSDGEKLFFAVKTELPPDGVLTAKVQPQENNDAQGVWTDDSVEFWIAPDKAEEKCYQIIINSLGAKYDAAYTAGEEDKSWSVKNWECKSTVKNGWWQIEACIPAAAFGLERITAGKKMGLRIARTWSKPSGYSDITPLVSAFKNIKTMATITFAASAPLIRMQGAVPFIDTQRTVRPGDLRLEILNQQKTDLTLTAENFSQQNTATPQYFSGEIIIPAGQVKTLSLINGGVLNDYFRVFTRLTSADGKTTYYARKFVWQVPDPGLVWACDEVSPGEVDLKIGYYPYYNRLKLKLDTRKADRVTAEIKYKLQDKKSGHVLVEGKFPVIVELRQAEVVVDLPKLKVGEYIVEAISSGSAKPETVLARKEFQRKIFEWEHNTIGMSEEILPPFLPLKIHEKTVSATLCSYQMNDLGLVAQVTSAGKEILAAPISLDININGKEEKSTAIKPLTFTKIKNNEIEYTSFWQAGPLKGMIKGTFDYDGFLKIELNFEMGDANGTLDKMDLNIPLKLEYAKLLHAIKDAARKEVHCAVPTGKNPVWESMFMDRGSSRDIDGEIASFPGTFVPYIWIGNARQGMAWVAEGDKDWLVNDNVSTHSISQYPDRVVLQVHLVNASKKLTRSHKIVFGLQATPSKQVLDLPVPWRTMTLNFDIAPFTSRIGIFGSLPQWGGDELWAFYPRKKDFSFYKLIKNTRDGKATNADWDAWKNGCDEFHPLNQLIQASIPIGRGIAESKSSILAPYLNPRGVVTGEDEFLTFQDEWLSSEYTSRKWMPHNNKLDYNTTLCRSRQDYMLWYCQKMLKSGAMDAIYMDNFAARPVRNTIVNSGYYDENGKYRAAWDLFDMREFAKRLAVLSWQTRGWNMNIVHMTGTHIVPLQSWFGMSLDWENKINKDTQDIYSREYIQSVTAGRQSGTVPLTLGSLWIRDINDKAKLSWVRRTLAGVLITHELKDWALGWGDNIHIYKDSLKKLYAFGYGDKNCDVYNYWADDYPAKITGIESSSLLLVRNGEALLVVTDYGNGGNCDVNLPVDALKLKKDGMYYDADSGAVLTKKDGGCTFDIKKHDFKIIYYR